jgi:cation diffusion facilitator family transporter
MSHYRKPLAAAAALNTVICIVEATAGFQVQSLSLIMDSVHNLSDEVALVLLYLAFMLSRGVSRNLVCSANFFNSVGLVAVSALLVWQAVERSLHSVPIPGAISIVVGLCAAAGNWGVARLLLGPSRNNPAIRLAYLHNMGDVFVSLAPAFAGLLVILTGQALFDALVAVAIGLWLIASTVREVMSSRRELVWPEKITCGHAAEEQAVRSSTVS